MKAIRELRQLDAAGLQRQVLPAFEPVVIRGLASEWPAVRAGRQGPQASAAYLLACDNGAPVDALLARPEPGRAFSYTPDYAGFNFIRDRRTISQLVEQLGRYSQFADPPMLAAQSALIDECLPDFARDNRLDALLDPAIRPRIWMGNKATVPAHFDAAHNIAVVACGRRRFTLFPPGQVANLTLGPPDMAPTAAPITLTNLSVPDFERFPRLREALDAGWQADLEPGDALYIPPLWLHHVESLETLNVLVNYWWRPVVPVTDRREDHQGAALWMAMLSFRHLPKEERQAWSEMFRYFVFDELDPAIAMMPPDRRGLMGALDGEAAKILRTRIRAWLDEAEQ